MKYETFKPKPAPEGKDFIPNVKTFSFLYVKISYNIISIYSKSIDAKNMKVQLEKYKILKLLPSK